MANHLLRCQRNLRREQWEPGDLFSVPDSGTNEHFSSVWSSWWIVISQWEGREVMSAAIGVTWQQEPWPVEWDLSAPCHRMLEDWLWGRAWPPLVACKGSSTPPRELQFQSRDFRAFHPKQFKQGRVRTLSDLNCLPGTQLWKQGSFHGGHWLPDVSKWGIVQTCHFIIFLSVKKYE